MIVAIRFVCIYLVIQTTYQRMQPSELLFYQQNLQNLS